MSLFRRGLLHPQLLQSRRGWVYGVVVHLGGVAIGTGSLMFLSHVDLSLHPSANPPVGLPAAQAQSRPTALTEIRLGVAQSPDNAAQWYEIIHRLHATGLTYQVIDWQQVEAEADLTQINVLLMPDVQTVTPGQLNALEAWVRQGGRLIVSGAIGDRSPRRVKRQLRSLLGGYWAFPLPTAATLQPVTTATRSWTVPGAGGTIASGGVLIPVEAGQTAGMWQDGQSAQPTSAGALNYNGSTAVVVTGRTTFLGWAWGSNSSNPEFDQLWLEAALDRYQNPASNSAAAAAPAPAPAPVPRPAVSPPAAYTISPRVLPLPGQRSPAPPAAPVAAPTPAPASPPRTPTTARRTPPPQPRSPRLMPRSPASQDPAEQVAPAGLPVEPSGLPITRIEAIAMRRELQNLIGRYESAFLSSASLDSDIELQAPKAETSDTDEPSLVASREDSLSLEHAAASPTSDALRQARAFLDTFPDLVAQRDYATARQQWLEIRQLLWDHFPTDRPQFQPEIRAVWLDRGTIVAARSKAGLTRIFDQLKAAGINTVFFETVNAGYPIYPSEVAPQQNPLTLSWDPLADAVELAHQRDMELHAWVWVFAAGNTRHNQIVNLPHHYPGPILDAYPDWANYDQRGNMIPAGQTKPFLDPANPAVRNYLLRVFEEIVQNYEVDGLQLDYIRYPFQDPGAGTSYGYGRAARQQFQNLTGVDPIHLSPRQTDLWQQWTDFRAEQVNSFVAETAARLRHIDPDLILSAAVFPMSTHERLHKIQQHWEVWAQQGNLNLIVPMSYAMDTNRLQNMVMPWLTEVDLGGTLVLPAVRLLDLPEAAVVDQMQAIRDLPAGGYALFAAADITETLQSVFNRTQGPPTHPEEHPPAPIPYRQPFHAAVGRFDALRREWSLMLERGHLRPQERQLDALNDHIDELAEALEELSDRPSTEQLQVTRTALADLRSHFNQSVRLQLLHDDYRIETWTNRLEALEGLLNYGERFVLTQNE